jgi:hypothetical protein
MLSEYIDMNNFLPALSSEIVHRVVEILKFFNTRTCQLVLGAGAMQVLIFCPNIDDLCILKIFPLKLTYKNSKRVQNM